MYRHFLAMLTLLAMLSVSVVEVLAQDSDEGMKGEAEVMSFFNNLGIKGEIVYTSTNEKDDRSNEENWCFEGDTWGDGRCDNPDAWVKGYNWWLGWLLAHCEIPGYFSPENWPEECNLLRDNLGSFPVFIVAEGGSTSAIVSGTSGGSGGGGSDGTVSVAFSYGCVDLDCTFEVIILEGDASSITGYEWDFGDGGSSTSDSATHSYSSGGSYTITLTITNSDGSTSTTSQTITVSEPSDNVGLVVSGLCNGDNFEIRIQSGDGPFDVGGSGPGLPRSGVGTGTITLGGPDAWTGVTVTETSGDLQSASLGNFDCDISDPGGGGGDGGSGGDGNKSLSASMSCNSDGDLVLTVSGDGPFSVTGSGRSLPRTVNEGSTSVSGPGNSPVKWKNVVVTETSGDEESKSLGNLTCQP